MFKDVTAKSGLCGNEEWSVLSEMKKKKKMEPKICTRIALKS
jgi:hypothetical protein